MTTRTTANTNRFADAPTNTDETAAAAKKAQEIAAKLSQTLTGMPTEQVRQSPAIGAGGSECVTIAIPVEKIGLIIGRSGSTIRNIQDTSGAKLQLDSFGEPTRLLRISGSVQSVDAAKAKVQGLLNQPTYGAKIPPKTIQIPSEFVGFVIGKGGETIKRISQETGCRLQIENEEQAREAGHNPPIPGHQHLHLIGTEETVSSAERAVKELLERKQKNGFGGGAGYGPHYQQAHTMRAQPYPTYAPNQNYGQFAPQAYMLPPNAIPGYPAQLQGYGSYVPQSALTGYPPQINQHQAAPGSLQPFQSNIAQPPPSYQFQAQQPSTSVQQQGYTPNQAVLQYSAQGLSSNTQQLGFVPQNTQQGMDLQQGPGVTQQQQGMGLPHNTQPQASMAIPNAVQSTNAAVIPNLQQQNHTNAPHIPTNQTQNINHPSERNQPQFPTGSQQYLGNTADSGAR